MCTWNQTVETIRELRNELLLHPSYFLLTQTLPSPLPRPPPLVWTWVYFGRLPLKRIRKSSPGFYSIQFYLFNVIFLYSWCTYLTWWVLINDSTVWSQGLNRQWKYQHIAIVTRHSAILCSYCLMFFMLTGLFFQIDSWWVLFQGMENERDPSWGKEGEWIKLFSALEK